MEGASDFFEKGAAGYSPGLAKHEGLLLQTYRWQVQPLRVLHVASSFFDNEALFPGGSVQFDNALLMKRVEHEWHSLPDKPFAEAE